MRGAVVLLAALAGCGSGMRAGDGGGVDAAPPDGGSMDGGDAARDDGGIDAGTDAAQDAATGDAGGDAGPRECAPTDPCDDGLDGDCDGIVDEECPCVPGDVAACYRGDPATRGVEPCRDGTMLCGDGLEFGTWGPCTGDAVPAEETCDAAGADEDCDGAPNDGCDCVEGDPDLPCGTGVGVCESGLQRCVAGRRTECEGGVGPTLETCDDEDDDCDGDTDEALARDCGSGTCTGREVCTAGAWGACDERCDPPAVMCPADRTTDVGTAVMLAGSGSDPDGGALTYAWSVVMRPVGSIASPAPPDAAATTFTPDVGGSYTLRLCVTDDEGETTCCTVTVTASSGCTTPPRPVLTACGTSWDRRPIVEFAALAGGTTLSLFKDADVAPYATITMDGQNYHRPAAPLGPGGPPPGATMTITARACLDAEPGCCSTSDPVTVRLVEACTTAVPPTAATIVFSEYVINGDGVCPGPDCEAGEAIEITNLSHCPVALAGHHFGYCSPTACGASRWMDFGAEDVIPPRGVYVAIRNEAASMCAYPFFGPDDPGLFGLRISRLAMQGLSLASGWFNNSGGGTSVLRIATGAWVDITSGTTLEIVSPYSGAAGECESIGFDAIDRCGEVSAVSTPTDVLAPNQLGRLWHPCDAVTAPAPATCR